MGGQDFSWVYWRNCGTELPKHSLSMGWVWKLSHFRADSVAERSWANRVKFWVSHSHREFLLSSWEISFHWLS